METTASNLITNPSKSITNQSRSHPTPPFKHIHVPYTQLCKPPIMTLDLGSKTASFQPSL